MEILKKERVPKLFLRNIKGNEINKLSKRYKINPASTFTIVEENNQESGQSSSQDLDFYNFSLKMAMQWMEKEAMPEYTAADIKEKF